MNTYVYMYIYTDEASVSIYIHVYVYIYIYHWRFVPHALCLYIYVYILMRHELTICVTTPIVETWGVWPRYAVYRATRIIVCLRWDLTVSCQTHD